MKSSERGGAREAGRREGGSEGARDTMGGREGGREGGAGPTWRGQGDGRRGEDGAADTGVSARRDYSACLIQDDRDATSM